MAKSPTLKCDSYQAPPPNQLKLVLQCSFNCTFEYIPKHNDCPRLERVPQYGDTAYRDETLE